MPHSVMNIADIQYSLETSSVEIYLAGCKGPHCPGCHNEGLWSFNVGLPWDMWMDGIIENYRFLGELARNIWVLGGEPLDQPHDELVKLLKTLHIEFPGASVWLFTKRYLDGVPHEIRMLCDYVKTGPYMKDEPTGQCEYGVQLASSNQSVFKIEHNSQGVLTSVRLDSTRKAMY